MINLTVNGITYPYPETGDSNWGDGATNWAAAVTSGMLSQAGGSFPLTAEVDFGGSFGLKALYLKSETANISTTGVVRLANADAIGWRNAVNGADLLLQPNADGILQYGSVDLVNLSATQTLTNKSINASNNTLTNIANAAISASAAIAYSKLALTASILNADISASAAIARSKIASGTASHVVINDGSGNLSSEAQLAATRGGTGVSSTATFPSSGTVATVPSSGVVHSNGTVLSSSNVALASEVTGTLPATNGGTGLATFTTGDILYASGTNTLSALPKGTSGQFLKIGASIPSWANVTAANPVVQSKTGNYTILATDDVVLGDSSGGTFTLTLPAASTAHFLYIKKTDSSFTAITIARAGSDTIDGATSTTINTQYEAIILVSDGSTSWEVLDRYYPQSWTSFTMSIAGSTSNPTKASSPAIDFARWRRVGDSIEIRYTYQATNNTGAAAGSGTYLFTLPNSLTIDTSKQPVNAGTTAGIYNVGEAFALDPTNESYENMGLVFPYDSTHVAMQVQGGGTGNATNSFTKVGSGFQSLATTTIRYTFKATVPITGWN